MKTPDQPPDRELIQRFVGENHLPSYEALVLRHLDRIRRILFVALRGDREAAAEGEQEVLIRLFRTLPRFRFQSLFTTYLYTLCRRIAVDLIRKGSRDRARWNQVLVLDYLPRWDFDQNELDPSREAMRNDWKSLLWRALGTLPEPDRSLLYHKDAEEVPLKELSRIFALPEGTIKSKLSRARERMKLILKEAGYDP